MKPEKQIGSCAILIIEFAANSTDIFELQLQQNNKTLKGIAKKIPDIGIFNTYFEEIETIMSINIFETDYTYYSIAYTCDSNNVESAWVFSRYEILTSIAEPTVKNLTQNHFNSTNFKNTCGNRPIIETLVCPFRNATQNLRINELSGEWFYLQQNGEYKFDCIRCFFEVTDNITNTFVVRTYGYKANSTEFSVFGAPNSVIDSAELNIYHSIMGSNYILY